MSRHEYFERLGAMAALGEISMEDLEELKTHIRKCDACQAFYDEYLLASRQNLPLVGSDVNRKQVHAKLSAFAVGYREQFLTRARAEGVRFSRDAERWTPSPKRASLRFSPERFAMAAAIVVLMAAGIVTYRSSKSLIERQRATLTGLRGEVSGLLSARHLLQTRLDRETQSEASLKTEISRTREARDQAMAHARSSEQQLASATAGAAGLRAQLEESAAKAQALQSRLQEGERRQADLSAEIQDLHAVHADSATTIAGERAQVERLTSQLQAERKLTARYMQLLAAGKDIRDLMGARGLQVVDVFDADGRGDNAKVFGRVFYTQGKSLVFYAFDLGNSNASKKDVSYVGWGEDAGGATQARELGIFYVDSAEQRRWVLRFDNPEVLRQINAVFVTIEPKGTRKQPTGQTLLYAYLNTPVNHP